MNEKHDPQLLQQLYRSLGYSQHHTEPLQVPAPPVTPRPSGCDLRRLCWHLDVRGALCELHRTTWAGHPSPTPTGAAWGRSTPAPRPGAVKGWHVHSRQTDRFTCVRGAVLVALCDVRHLLEPCRATASYPAATWTPWCWTAAGACNSSRSRPAWCTAGARWTTATAMVLDVCSHLYDGTDE